MLIKGRIRKEVTPKRVFSVLKLINMYNGKLKEEEICDLVQPSRLCDKEEKYEDSKKVIKFLKDEKFINENIDKKLELNINSEDIKDIRSFKEYFSKNVFNNMKEDSLFFEVTSEILSKDLDFYEFSSFDEIGRRLENKEVDKEFILAWRFWAEFLGFGNILNNQFLINPYVRILDRVINNLEYEEKKYPISRFIMMVKQECPEFRKIIENNSIGLSLTLALRTLEGLGKIKMLNVRDSTDIWKLYYSTIEKTEITDIEIVRGI
ncbi:hypothetical protein ACSXDQ_03030 [Clostridium perfringens]|uniref:Uncharacterized protein n=1 Tax=Clostridium perfringens TaxID=1502 RepID=A0AAP4A4G4_CLOPF|nr:hypothetical protein [Clostridium perfringens]MDH2334693.1 hypothetical protein [Clostridium perfringens]